GLGRDLPATGRLSPDGVEAALVVLRRFRALLDGWRANEVLVVATAAVRDAADGPMFLKKVRDETGLTVRLLGAEDEAGCAGPAGSWRGCTCSSAAIPCASLTSTRWAAAMRSNSRSSRSGSPRPPCNGSRASPSAASRPCPAPPWCWRRRSGR